jgi:hypothetical protein
MDIVNAMLYVIASILAKCQSHRMVTFVTILPMLQYLHLPYDDHRTRKSSLISA